MSWTTVNLDWNDDVATITVNRPDSLNALDRETLVALGEAIEETDEARAVVLTGAGGDVFVAGADIGAMQEMETTEAREYTELGHRVFDMLQHHDAPVVAAVNGYALGGGCELALACDIRIASEDAVFGQTEIDLGIIPGWGGTQRLPRIVGDGTARRMLFLGERLGAEEAANVGLVQKVVPSEELDETVTDLADELAAKPRVAMAASKEALNQALESPESSGLAFERRLWSGLFGTHDQREGMKAFLEKREPEFE